MGNKEHDPATIKDPFRAFDDYFRETYPSYRKELSLRRILEPAFIAGVVWATAHQRICLNETLRRLNKWLTDAKKREKDN